MGYLWVIFKISLSERTSGVPPVIFLFDTMVLEQVTLKKSQRLGVVSSWQSKYFEHIFQSGWKTQKLRQKLTPTHGTGETHVDLELYFTNERKS